MRRPVLMMVIGAMLTASAVGCARTRAASAPDGPPLQVPEPPERVLAPVEEPLVVTTPPLEPEPTVAAAPPPRTPPGRPTPEPKPQPSTPPVPAAAAPPPRPPVETRELRPA